MPQVGVFATHGFPIVQGGLDSRGSRLRDVGFEHPAIRFVGDEREPRPPEPARAAVPSGEVAHQRDRFRRHRQVHIGHVQAADQSPGLRGRTDLRDPILLAHGDFHRAVRREVVSDADPDDAGADDEDPDVRRHAGVAGAGGVVAEAVLGDPADLAPDGVAPEHQPAPQHVLLAEAVLRNPPLGLLQTGRDVVGHSRFLLDSRGFQDRRLKRRRSPSAWRYGGRPAIPTPTPPEAAGTNRRTRAPPP